MNILSLFNFSKNNLSKKDELFNTIILWEIGDILYDNWSNNNTTHEIISFQGIDDNLNIVCYKQVFEYYSDKKSYSKYIQLTLSEYKKRGYKNIRLSNMNEKEIAEYETDIIGSVHNSYYNTHLEFLKQSLKELNS
jgi:hypothetical protein